MGSTTVWKAIVIGLAIAFVCLLAAALVAQHNKASVAAVEGEQPPPTVTMPATPPPKERTVLDEKTLAGAMIFSRPNFGQAQIGVHSNAFVEMLVWASRKMKWSDVATATDETNYGMAQKDIDAERGKRLCISGTLVQISGERLGVTKVFEGIIQSAAGNLFSFGSVGSSGTLVQESWARLCGVVVDKFDYPNSAGGTGHAIDVVGIFDLPENQSLHVDRNQPIAVENLPRAPAGATHAQAPLDCDQPFTTDSAGRIAFKPGCK